MLLAFPHCYVRMARTGLFEVLGYIFRVGSYRYSSDGHGAGSLRRVWN